MARQAAPRASRLREPWLASFAVAIGLGAACGGRGGNGDEITAPDAGDHDVESLEDLTAPPGTFIVLSELQPPASACQADTDCAGSGPSGGSCTPLTSSYRICVPEAPIATAPSSNPTGDECDATRPCAEGACYETLRFPSGQCGLGGASVQNSCRNDSCDDDADCGAGLCGPPGLTSDESETGGAVRQCFATDCRSDGDCQRFPGGVCALVDSSCGGPGPGTLFRAAQLACVYPRGCVRSSDCPNGACSIVEGVAVCLAGAG